jgi:hypothetical protein
MTKVSAKQKMLNTLNKGNKLSVAQARARYGIKNVAARIYDLRKEGHNITTTTVKRNGIECGVYHLAKKITSRKAQVTA